MCLTPINLKKETWKQKLQNTYHMQEVPCGRCIECMKARGQSWHLRLSTELKRSESAYFITLTYSEDSIPFSPNGLASLKYRDVQNFFKRLRRLHHGKPIKYFVAQEYGEKTHRPHYHAIIYNAGIETIEQAWDKGHCHFGEVNDKTIHYVLKYALKRATHWNKKVDPDDDRNVECARMSKGLGLNYLTPEMIKYHKENLKACGNYLSNNIPLPRYYRDKIYTDPEKLARNRLLDPSEETFDKRSSPHFPQKVEQLYVRQEEKQKKTD